MVLSYADHHSYKQNDKKISTDCETVGNRPKNLADMSAKGGGNPLSAKKM